MRLRPLSVRVRLTLWYAGVLLFTLACLSIGVYAFVKTSLDRALDAQLDRDFDTVATVVAASPQGKGPGGHLPGDVLFAVMEADRVVYHSDGWCRAKFFKDAYREPVGSTGVWRSRQGLPHRFKVRSLFAKGRDLKMTVAEDTTTIDDTLGTLLAVLLLSSPCALLLAIGGGYFLAGRALSPISAMAAKAREITAESLSERLPLSNPDDELGRMATVFNETLERLQGSFDRLRAFTANVSHELRTPLTAIRSVGEVALQPSRDPAACREVIGSMLEEVDRLTRLIDSLLTLARADAGRKPVSSEVVDLSAIATSAVELVRVLAEEKEQSLSLEAAPGALVRADEGMLRQALTNLLDNAIRYTPARGHIVVNVARLDGRVRVEVTDDGPGIPEQDRGRVFDRFYRSGDDRREASQGTGLGLAIARSAIEANGGRLEYQTVKSGGSTFRAVFPAAHEKRSSTPVASAD